MNKKSRRFAIKAVTMVLALFAIGEVLATDWFLNRAENSGSMAAWYNAGYWRKLGVSPSEDGKAGDPLCADDNYYVRWNYYVRAAPNASGVCEFNGKVLSIGYMDSGILLQYAGSKYVTTFKNDGLILKIGGWYAISDLGANQTCAITGPIAVTATEANPFCVFSAAAGTTFDWQTSLTGAKATALRVGVGMDISGATAGADGFTLKLSGDCSAYAGTIVVTSLNAAVASAVGTKLELATSSLPGSVVLTPKTKLVVTSTSGSTVGSLSATDETSLDLSAGGALTVTNSFVKTGDEALPVAVSITDDTFADWTKTNQFVILTMPKTSDVGAEDFAVTGITGTRTFASHQGFRIVDNGDDTKSLVAEFGPLVYQTVADTGNFNYQNVDASSLTHADHWSDGELPHKGAHYITATAELKGTQLNTPGPRKSAYAFDMDSLTVKGMLFLFNIPVSVPVLRICNGSSVYVGNNGSGTIAGGKVITDTKAILSAYSGALLKVESELEGNAEIWVGRVGGTGAPHADNEFSGTNINFKGTFYIGQNIEPTFGKLFQTLYVSDERNLGGKLDAFTFNALKVDRLSRVRTRESFTLTTDYNRGVKMGPARFYADAGKTIGMKTQLTMSGTVWKEGDGVLDMGGTIKFYNSNTKQPQDAVIAGKNDFIVTGGVLRVSSAYAVNGLNLAFAPETKLVLRLNAADADLTAKGLVNVKSDAPFALNPSLGGKLPFSLETESGTTVAPGDTFALVTVSSVAADAVAEMLPSSVRLSRGLRARIERRASAADGSVTFVGCFESCGTLFTIR